MIYLGVESLGHEWELTGPSASAVRKQRDEYSCSVPFLLSIQSKNHLTLTNLNQKIPQRHSQSFVSIVSLNPVKLTVKINFHAMMNNAFPIHEHFLLLCLRNVQIPAGMYQVLYTTFPFLQKYSHKNWTCQTQELKDCRLLPLLVGMLDGNNS